MIKRFVELVKQSPIATEKFIRYFINVAEIDRFYILIQFCTFLKLPNYYREMCENIIHISCI
jgi:hypothetical protein